jgi:hypothetical protein
MISLNRQRSAPEVVQIIDKEIGIFEVPQQDQVDAIAPASHIFGGLREFRATR